MTTAFVFAGGGSLGAVEVGMLQALVERGEHADVIVGASAGAINGAYFAADPCADAVGRLAGIWRGLKRSHVFPFDVRSVLGLFRRRDYLVGAHGLRALLERHLPYRQLEEARVPMHVIATELVSGDEVVRRPGRSSTRCSQAPRYRACFRRSFWAAANWSMAAYATTRRSRRR